MADDGDLIKKVSGIGLETRATPNRRYMVSRPVDEWDSVSVSVARWSSAAHRNRSPDAVPGKVTGVSGFARSRYRASFSIT